jgi:hypothetical protein
MKTTSKILLLGLCVLLQAGCGTKAVYIDESFSVDSPFKIKTRGDTTLACESVRRALLGQGYLIDLATSEEVKARKATRGEGKQNSFIEMNAVCVPDTGGSTIFATGVLSTYAMKMSSSSASVGVSAIGSISLPIGQSVDSLVKVAEQTIDDKDFYKRFFTAVEAILGEMETREPAEEIAEETAVPETTSEPVVHPAIWPELFPENTASEEAPADTESATQPLTQPAILPDLFPGNAATGAESQQQTGQTEQTAPAVAPSVSPGETGTAPIAAPVQDQQSPAASTETTSQDLPSAETPEGRAGQQPAMTNAVPGKDEEQMGISPTPAPDEEPMGISVQSVNDEEPLGILPAPPAAQKTPAADASQLAPIQVTPVTRKSMPAALQVMPKQVTPKPAAEDTLTPGSSVENIF